MMMPGDRSEKTAAERDFAPEEGSKAGVAIRVEHKLNSTNAALRHVDVVAAGESTDWSREIQVKPDFLLVTPRIFTETGQTVVPVARQRATDANSIRFVPQACGLSALRKQGRRGDCQEWN